MAASWKAPFWPSDELSSQLVINTSYDKQPKDQALASWLKSLSFALSGEQKRSAYDPNVWKASAFAGAVSISSGTKGKTSACPSSEISTLSWKNHMRGVIEVMIDGLHTYSCYALDAVHPLQVYESFDDIGNLGAVVILWNKHQKN
jgi:hypothetical protein